MGIARVLGTAPLCLACLCRASALGAGSERIPEAALRDDSVCSDNADGECDLSLRQLRASARGLAMAPPSAPQRTPAGEAEAAEPVAEAEGARQADAASSLLSWGSCSQYGCIDYYNSHHGCQCNYKCVKYHSCCWDYWHRCRSPPPTPAPTTTPAPAPAPVEPTRTDPSSSDGDDEDDDVDDGRNASRNASSIKTLYHQTSSSRGHSILATGFRPGHVGYCGGAIYFAETKKATNGKAIGPDSHKGFMIEVEVDVGRVLHASKWCDRTKPPPSHPVWDGPKLKKAGYDSITFNPGDGAEWVIYNNSSVISMKHVSCCY